MARFQFRGLERALALTVIAGFAFGLPVAAEEKTKEEKKCIVVSSSDQEEGEGGAFLGVYLADLDQDAREAMELEKVDGVLIQDVVDGGPAEKAGLQSKDIVTKLGGEAVTSTKELRKAMESHRAGDAIEIAFLREGKEKSAMVTLGEQPERDFPVFSDEPFEHNENEHNEKRGFLGVGTITLEDQLAAYFEVKSGALVQSVVKDSPAEKVGIKAGDIITKVNEEGIESTEDLVDAIRDFDPKAEVEVTYVRKGKEMKVKAMLDETSSFSDFGRRIEKSFIFPGGEGRDLDDLKEKIHEALRDADIHIESSREEMKESIEELKQEMTKLKEELTKMKEEKKKSQ